MSEIKTIEKKLEEQAVAKLKKDIKESLASITKLAGFSEKITVKSFTNVKEPMEVAISFEWLLKQINERIFEIKKDQYVQREIDVFMKSVTSIRADVDDLYNSINN